MNNSNQIIHQHEIKPGIEEIRLYTNSRYPRWLDYSRYHSSLAGIPDEATDVLNEVLLSLFSKDPQFQERLYKTKKGQYREFDFYILRLIKLNCHSQTLFEETSKKAFKTFEDFRCGFTEKYSKTLLKYISFDNDTAFLSDESKNQIDEDCSVFVEKPEEIEAYNRHLKACEALNDMFQGHKSPAWPQFFEMDKNGKFIPGELVNYDVLVTNIKKVKENG